MDNRIVVEVVPIDSIHPDPSNARIHPPKNLSAIKGSLARFGQQKPIVVTKDNVIRAGNGTWQAAKDLGWTEISVVRSELVGSEAVGYGIADNRSGELAEWDDDILGAQLSGLTEDGWSAEDLENIGFDPNDLADFDLNNPSDNSGTGSSSSLADRFLIPPFSVFDARQGYWQERKRAWIDLGIKSGEGRGENLLRFSEVCNSGGYPSGGLTFVKGGHRNDPVSEKNLQVSGGTSIFDPVLAEIIYSWFCPPGGRILDPFAGGSVRGIVAGKLGREYLGIDLRPEQVQENQKQWEMIGKGETNIGPGKVKISAAMARLKFHGCDPEYIQNICKSRCCHSSTNSTGTLITIHPTEQPAIEALGGKVINGLLQPRLGEKKCPFKTEDELCGLHNGPDKPFGCIASPFTLNKSGTLIIRNRYKLLHCYDEAPRIPAYKAFRSSLDLIFGNVEAERICNHLDSGGGDIESTISEENYRKLVENDEIKHGGITEEFDPHWIVGDSRNLRELAGEQFDFLFSCPPYMDLERYSKDPRDLSTLDPDEFFLAYDEIIKNSVAMLKSDSFACFVVGEVRGKKGNYRKFIPGTIEAFEKAGANYYNEIILVNAIGTLPIRVGEQFTTSRKVGKTHQNVLVFIKGDPRKATERIGPVNVADIEPTIENGNSSL